VECSLVAKKYSALSAGEVGYVDRTSAGVRANIALARKFLGVIYHTLKNNWVFEDFPNFVLAS
jgi:transposase